MTAVETARPGPPLLLRVVPLYPLSLRRAGTLVRRNLLVARRSWLIYVSGFVEPLFYLLSIGAGIGGLVGQVVTDGGATVSYQQFVAPGLMASAAMNGAVYDAVFNIFWKLRYAKLYDAVLATPARVGDVLTGHLLYVTVRVTTSVTLFLVVLTLVGAAHRPLVVLALPAAVLTGLAFAAPVTALAVRMENDSGFAGLQRFLVLPVFLFSGTFFPVSQLPAVLEWVAYGTPLWHGVALSRGLALGTMDGAAALLHVGYLALWVAAGVALAARGFRKRLVT